MLQEIAARILIVIAAAIMSMTTGCATSYNRCTFERGDMKLSGTSRSTVIGKGTTEALVENTFCGELLYETDATGISDNAVKVIEKAVQGAVKGMKGGV